MSKVSTDRAGWIRAGFIQRLQDEGWSQLGCGAFSEVYGSPDHPYVYKVGVLQRTDDGWLRYAKLVMEKFSTNCHAPRIFKLKVFDDFYIAKMEKLEFTVDQSADPEHYEFFEKVADCLFLNPSGPETWEFEQQHPELADLMAGIRTMPDRCPDFHDQNAMFRHDGTFVIIDPIY